MPKEIRLRIKEDAFSPLFKVTYPCKSRYLIEKGGAASGKSERAAGKIILRMILEDSHRIVIWRKVGRSLRNSAFKLIKDLIKRWNLGGLFEIKETEMVVINKVNGNELLFLGLDDTEKIKSLTSPTMFWLEEMSEFEEEDFNQLDTRLRGYSPNYKQIYGTFNPISEYHWIRERFFDDYYDKLIETKKHCTYEKEVKILNETLKISTTLVHSTYLDNPFLDAESKAVYESYKDIDQRHYEVYALGKWGSLGNLIFPNGFLMTDEYPEDYDEIIYGLDFGFRSPTAFVKVGIRDKEYYVEELLYEKGLTIDELAERLIEFETDRFSTIYADSAEPASIKRLSQIFTERGAKFEIRKSDKSVKDGLSYMLMSRIHTNKNNVKLNKELKFYKWRTNSEGKVIEGEPLKINDHLIDAVRYAIYTHSLMHELKMAFI